MKEQFASLPPATRAYIAQRESEATAQISRLGQQAKTAEPILKTLEQHKATFERNGLSYADGINALATAQAMLDHNPQAAIKHIADAYGVDLQGFANQPIDAPSREVLALQAQVAQLSQQLEQTTSHVRSREEHEAQQRLASLQTAVDEFSKDKADMALVEGDMIALIPAIRSRNQGLSEKEILTAAYEQAVWINPELRAKRIAAETAKAAAEAQKKAEAAKKVSSLNVRSGQTARPSRMSETDELAAIWDRNHG